MVQPLLCDPIMLGLLEAMTRTADREQGKLVKWKTISALTTGRRSLIHDKISIYENKSLIFTSCWVYNTYIEIVSWHLANQAFHSFVLMELIVRPWSSLFFLIKYSLSIYAFWKYVLLLRKYVGLLERDILQI